MFFLVFIIAVHVGRYWICFTSETKFVYLVLLLIGLYGSLYDALQFLTFLFIIRSLYDAVVIFLRISFVFVELLKGTKKTQFIYWFVYWFLMF